MTGRRRPGSHPTPRGPLAADDDRLADRPYLRAQMRQLEEEGVEPAAWLSTLPTISGITSALTRTGADVVVVAENAKRRILERTLEGSNVAHAIATIVGRNPQLGDATVIEVADDGTATTIREGTPSSASLPDAGTGDIADAHDTPGSGQGHDATPAQGADTLSAVLARAADEGYGEQFVAQPDGTVRCGRCDTAMAAQTLHIAHVDRLEGASDPADQLIVLWARCPACGNGGVLTLGYGPNASEADVAVLTALPTD